MIVALDPDRPIGQRRRRVLVVAPVVQGSHRRDQHSNDTEEIGNRVADGGARGVSAGLARRRQRGGVRHRTGERAGDQWNIHPHRLADVQTRGGGYAVERHHREDRTDGGLEIVEEGSTRVDADGKREESQAEGAQLRCDPQFDSVGLSPGGRDDGEEQDRGGAEADALDLQVPESHSDPDQQEEEQHGLLAQDLEDLLHDENSVV